MRRLFLILFTAITLSSFGCKSGAEVEGSSIDKTKIVGLWVTEEQGDENIFTSERCIYEFRDDNTVYISQMVVKSSGSYWESSDMNVYSFKDNNIVIKNNSLYFEAEIMTLNSIYFVFDIMSHSIDGVNVGYNDKYQLIKVENDFSTSIIGIWESAPDPLGRSATRIEFNRDGTYDAYALVDGVWTKNSALCGTYKVYGDMLVREFADTNPDCEVWNISFSSNYVMTWQANRGAGDFSTSFVKIN